MSKLAISLFLSLLLAGCGAADASGTPGAPGANDDAGNGDDALGLGEIGPRPAVTPIAHPARYATKVVSFTQGDGGGFGADRLPAILEGPPNGGGCCYGGTDVLSLGNGGEIVIGFDEEIVDGDGNDFVVFENAFRIANDPANIFTELGEVAVSEDGVTWTTFPCDPKGNFPYGTCAGWNPVNATPDEPVDVTASAKAGGDGFDLATIGVKRAKLVRIRDLRSNRPAQMGMGGFDLDAIAVLHW
jgi:hypothetical protein